MAVSQFAYSDDYIFFVQKTRRQNGRKNQHAARTYSGWQITRTFFRPRIFGILTDASHSENKQESAERVAVRKTGRVRLAAAGMISSSHYFMRHNKPKRVAKIPASQPEARDIGPRLIPLHDAAKDRAAPDRALELADVALGRKKLGTAQKASQALKRIAPPCAQASRQQIFSGRISRRYYAA